MDKFDDKVINVHRSFLVVQVSNLHTITLGEVR